MTNEQILTKLGSAIKGITELTTMGDAILQPEKFDRFVQEMEAKTVILPDARFLKMESHKKDIDRISMSGRILKAGKTSVGASRELSTNEFSEPSTDTNQLVSKELLAVASLRDETLRKNIEKGNLEQTVISLMGSAAGRDMEEYATFADSNISYATDDVLSQTDGWIKLAANKVYGRNVTGQVARDFDTSADTYPENMFDAMIDAMPKKYIGSPADFKIYVTWAVRDAYQNLLKSRGTALGDSAQSSSAPLYYKGFEVVYAPVLERATSVDLTDDDDVKADVVAGNVAILVNPDNLVWGVFHQVTIEPEREAKLRRTDFVLTLEADAHYEDENAVVVAMIDKANPTAVEGS